MSNPSTDRATPPNVVILKESLRLLSMIDLPFGMRVGRVCSHRGDHEAGAGERRFAPDAMAAAHNQQFIVRSIAGCENTTTRVSSVLDATRYCLSRIRRGVQ